MGPLLTTLLPVLAGALISFVPNYLLELRRENAQLRTRWDQDLFELCSEYIASARILDDFSERLAAQPPGSEAGAEVAALTAAEHQRLRALSEKLRVLGNLEVQLAARWVLRHAYAVRETAEGRPDPRAADFPGSDPRVRLREALDELYLAVRRQLRVADPEVISPREPELPKSRR